ncbi:hypothetical protein JTE90_018794 [Oedothorax gibbosus]|uniref:Uncharacterized protein n=1 Tax=Oedothorax gibbosus TaxID=931172 RepID=A0AAV6TRG6_9ARAC|nr:hypothetical protein JTE90_018794 [Oedothorax gibbosus]
MTENPTDLEPITPDMFLKDIDEVGTPDLDMKRAKTWTRDCDIEQNLEKQLLRRFRNEYLGQLKMQLPKLKSREIMLDESFSHRLRQ